MAEAILEAGSASAVAPKRQLTLFDSTCIIVGIIIGATFYESTPMIAQGSPSVLAFVGIWVLGGLLSLIGAMCYAELATAYPASGGDYVYLTRAFGRPMGFVFAWAQLWIVRPGSVGAMAFVFARYADQLLPLGRGNTGLLAYAVGSVVVLTAINIIGVREGKWTQNLLTVLKALGVIAIFAVGMLHSAPSTRSAAGTTLAPISGLQFKLALIMIFWAYGGWNEMAYVAAEVRNPTRNILRSLVLGTLAVTLIYALAAIAFVHALGLQQVRTSDAIAADVLRFAGGEWAGRFISALICVTALGAINGLIFTGARITYAVGAEHWIYGWFGRWNAKTGTPLRALIGQAIVTIALAVGFARAKNGFTSFVIFESPVFWVFFLLVGIGFFALRWREPHAPRPYRVPLYPIVPALFCLSSAFMAYSSLEYALANRSMEALWSVGILAVGFALCLVDRKPATKLDQVKIDR